MKKATVRTLVLTLVLALLCMGAQAADTSAVVGTWYLNAMEFNGASIHPSIAGMEMTLVLNEDGSTAMQMTGADAEAGTWTLEGETVTIENEFSPAIFILEGDTLVMDQGEDGKMIYGKEKVEAVPFEAAPIQSATDVAEFDGVWNGTSVDFAGMVLPIAMGEMELTFTVTGGMVQLNLVQPDTEISGEARGELVDGALVVSVDASGITRELRANLLEDGTMVIVLEPEAAATTIYCEKAE